MNPILWCAPQTIAGIVQAMLSFTWVLAVPLQQTPDCNQASIVMVVAPRHGGALGWTTFPPKPGPTSAKNPMLIEIADDLDPFQVQLTALHEFGHTLFGPAHTPGVMDQTSWLPTEAELERARGLRALWHW